MHRELFTIPGTQFTIYGYGLLLVLACLAGIATAKWLARRCGINPEHFVNIGVIALVSGVVGARLVNVLQEWPQYTRGTLVQNLWHIINLREGGLVYYGGFLLATPFCIAYGLWHKIPILRGMDIIAPCLMIGLGIGRVGCYLNGCCWGGPCTLPWAAQFPYGSPPFEEHAAEGLIKPDAELIVDQRYDHASGIYLRTEPRLRTKAELNTPQLQAKAAAAHSAAIHPTQIYSTITALLIAGACIAYFTTNPAPGRVFALMLLLEGVGRFTIENLRIEPPVLHIGNFAWSISMAIGVGLVIAGAIIMPTFGLMARKKTGRTA